MVQSVEDWRRDDAMTITNLMVAVDGATFHTLRHTAASLLAELGEPEAIRKTSASPLCAAPSNHRE